MLEILDLHPEAFGLDISDLSLKFAKLKKIKGGLNLVSFNESEIKPGIIKEGEVIDEDALAETIKSGLSKIKGEKLKTRYVVASLPEEKAFLRIIQMPKMEKEELNNAIRFEAENHIPLPINDVYLDFKIVQPFVDHLDHLDILIAALPKKTVDPYIRVFKKAKLQPKTLEIESLAISRAMVKNGISPFPLLLIDLGATRTSFIIFSGYSLRFTSSIPVSSQKFTESVAANLKVDLAEAERLKEKYGLSSRKDPEGFKVFEALIPALTDLIEQIKSHIYYYQTHSLHEHLGSEEKVASKVLLSGGGANLKGLPEFLSGELKTSVELSNPWVNILPARLKQIPVLPFQESLGYTTALGLALRGVNEK